MGGAQGRAQPPPSGDRLAHAARRAATGRDDPRTVAGVSAGPAGRAAAARRAVGCDVADTTDGRCDGGIIHGCLAPDMAGHHHGAWRRDMARLALGYLAWAICRHLAAALSRPCTSLPRWRVGRHHLPRRLWRHSGVQRPARRDTGAAPAGGWANRWADDGPEPHHDAG